ncbi:hypothetical protein HPB50_025046 [Hyalomma asiaticum]|uniref:Uncharacterized protein n=1 Tax=Hyalomma asiaticum TaxID=266040 RepID=A0ACB7TCB0_HYAAI|nr:hypothetical protein HPB50_025046 [Hyalomma asiaticum]
MGLSYAFAGLLVFAAMTSAVTASTTPSCVNVTLNNILNLSSCLGDNLNFCSSGTSGIYTYGSPQGIVNALGPLLSLIINRLGIPSINLPVLGNSSSLNFFLKNDTCQGQITVQLPGLGNISSTNQVQSLVQTLVCILRQIPLDQFRQVIMGIGCQLLTILSSLASNASLDASLRTALGSLSTALRVIVPTSACPPQDAVCARPASTWQSVNAADAEFYTEPHRSVSPPSTRPDRQQRCDFNSRYRRPRTDYYEEARAVGRGSYPDAPVYFEEPFGATDVTIAMYPQISPKVFHVTDRLSLRES